MKTLFENWKKHMLMLTEVEMPADQKAAFLASAAADAQMLIQKAQSEAMGDAGLQQEYLEALVTELSNALGMV
jgi:hypothetical protein|tara:strand:+ start:139 stop:357 length:219 start_codon:yes stop_codon:yes gene_type:complete